MVDELGEAARRFEENRARLRAVAYRMLGSLAEAEDAVQETWLRYSRADTAEVANLPGWLTTVTGRVCLNMLRARRTRREVSIDAVTDDGRRGADTELERHPATDADPEREAVMADSVGLALLVLLDTLSPGERLAFVLHDMFTVPFEEIAPLVDRSAAATRQLASRARRRVKGGAAVSRAELDRQRPVVDAFLTAVRGADLEALVALLDPSVTLRADRHVVPSARPITISGATTVAETAMAATGRARFTGLVLIDGAVGLLMAPGGRLRLVLRFGFDGERITGIDVVADPARLAELELAVVGD
ncbi:sigma-70 family RNA polymerase sigma factor [Stackebrandtia nassauensis]|uniref:RNA polymerase, sigma-24 subunit, ECF subfamily n=1 Tax=Stackebrandtia nassauensis (strain DSM 44728 / CIP 108903 / NRRL B-16338 / NBRC 102104 / LLR-40K-21) TaxID=446470 RepID=D3Q1U8_STANL|nr:sigma-70 family RNA polymerase sigma factor [Stackebrandtia nassauensis]ADD39946.1 RNA polymerase, sigma-24 subunit, ECF subfamily [Stackebrandtia nassauensis DSM 44728]